MRGGAVKAGVVGAAIAALLVAGVAYATTVPDVLYKPPTLKFTDRYLHATGEDLTVTKQGPNYLFANPDGTVGHPDSDPGCDMNYSTEFKCPVQGVQRLVLALRGADDRARVNLGARAHKVKQIVKGGEGADRLIGGKGRQWLRGGTGDDRLRGGPGNDVLLGGPGTDDCRGGRGRDIFRGCE